MAALLPSSLLLMLARTEHEATDDLLAPLLILSVVLVLGVALWVFMFGAPKSSAAVASTAVPCASNSAASQSAPRHASPAASQSAPQHTPQPSRVAVVPSVVPTLRRVIRLHSTTPGQSPHEYNVGDTLGRRGSALVRAA
ncbi:MAG TPA: hypothetical protein VJV79_40900 [Polyangiaceae bacterium]|nr:hypothetical protein [Polyangiaceae bacterium]